MATIVTSKRYGRLSCTSGGSIESRCEGVNILRLPDASAKESKDLVSKMNPKHAAAANPTPFEF